MGKEQMQEDNTQTPKESNNPHDKNFKELIRELFKEFIELFLPEKVALIDFSDVTFLDKEVYTDRTPGKGSDRRLDIVVKVKLDGEEQNILIHVEHQSSKGSDFQERMFDYYCHLRLVHKKPIYPIALFTDDVVWDIPVPDHYEDITLGKKIVDFNYDLIKLKKLNWRNFLGSENPVAIALMAKMEYNKEERTHLKAQILRIIGSGVIRDEKKSRLVRDFVEYYLPLDKKETIICKKELESLGVKEEEVEMVLSKPYQEKLDEGILIGKLETIENMLKEGFDWSVITKITGVTQSEFEQLKK
jgi:hypothetical protein